MPTGNDIIPPPRYPMPAPRYEVFIKAFELEVAKVQKTIEDMRANEASYNLAREALELAKLKNDINLELRISGAQITVKTVSSDKLADFAGLYQLISERMMRHGHDGRPSIDSRHYNARRDYVWRIYSEPLRRWTHQVQLTFLFPPTGLLDVAVERSVQAWASELFLITDRILQDAPPSVLIDRLAKPASNPSDEGIPF